MRASLFVLLLAETSFAFNMPSFRGTLTSHSECASRSSSYMVFELPGAASPWSWNTDSKPEIMYEGGSRVEFLMETIHLTKRRVSGSVIVDAPAKDVWACITDYE